MSTSASSVPPKKVHTTAARFEQLSAILRGNTPMTSFQGCRAVHLELQDKVQSFARGYCVTSLNE